MKKEKEEKIKFPKLWTKYSVGNILLCTMFTSFPILFFGIDVVVNMWKQFGYILGSSFGFIFLFLFFNEGTTLMNRDNIEYLKEELDKAKKEIEQLKEKLDNR